jgi:hypothetical protein
MKREDWISDAGSERRYRTEIPNIVLSLGLSPFELTLYVHLKRTTGPEGVCRKSTATLAKEAGMSGGMVSKAKDGLGRRFAELGGRSLITVEEVPNPHGGKPYHHIRLADIWLDNAKKFTQPSSHSEIATSPHEIKKEPLKKEPRKKGSKSHSAKAAKVPSDSPSLHPAVQAVRAALGRYPQKVTHRRIIEAVGDNPDVDFMLECATAFASKGKYTGDLTVWLFDWYVNRRIPANGKGKSPPGDGFVRAELTPEIIMASEGVNREEAMKILARL